MAIQNLNRPKERHWHFDPPSFLKPSLSNTVW